MNNITKTDLENYLDEISLKDLYINIHDRLCSIEDTLSDEFQILAELEDIFWKYAQKKI